MYTFSVKGDGPQLDIITTRAMLALSALAAMVYHSGNDYNIHVILSGALLLTALFFNVLMARFNLKRWVLFTGAALMLFAATHSVGFAVSLMAYGYLAKYLNQKPIVEFSAAGIQIKKVFSNQIYQWGMFSNIILKDGLLTLDFRSNRLLQVNIDENIMTVDENAFNDFCKQFIQ